MFVCLLYLDHWGEISKTFRHVMAAPEISDPATALVEGTRHWGHRPSASLPEESRPSSELEDIAGNSYDDLLQYLILLVTELFRLDLIDLAGPSGQLAQFCSPAVMCQVGDTAEHLQTQWTSAAIPTSVLCLPLVHPSSPRIPGSEAPVLIWPILVIAHSNSCSKSRSVRH